MHERQTTDHMIRPGTAMDGTSIAMPEGFLFGAATSPHQVEGSNVNSDWWAYEHAPSGPISELSGPACDSYHHWREDMRLLADAGFNAYRFGIEWARIEPKPGVFDEAEIAHYGEMIDGARGMGLSALVTLHHFTLPLWFARQGGWTSSHATEHFLQYISAVMPILKHGVTGIVTINEPNMVAILGRVTSGEVSFSDMEPGVLPDPDPSVALALKKAHHAAADMLHRELPGVAVGWSVANQCVQALHGGEERARAYSQSIEDQFILAAEHDDFIGIQSYTRTVFGADGKRVQPRSEDLTSNGWEYYPQAVGGAIEHTHALIPQVPLLVTENGISTHDDEQRISYTQGALQSISSLLVQGLPIRGYFHWSLLDNYEWGSWEPTFGLASVDRSSPDFTRIAKPSLAWLGNWAKLQRMPCR
ncbi:MAG: family 1 glycosylhydrolase [Bifidobacterium sp.]|uniref:Family 1 glycosylhydrolase n=1 Tax=Bifidobacterium fermentum TaxID=3059035 RepID=A0AB39UIY7_9BIFI